MPRQPRPIYEHALYHVMNRGRNKRVIFHNPAYYHLFMKVLAKTATEQGCIVYAYCLMTNHFHIMVRTPLGNINEFMKRLCGEYVQKYNYFAQSDGSLFRDRYRSVLVLNDKQALYLSRYIHRNPVDCVQQLAANPLEFAWSSLRHYTSTDHGNIWLDTDWVTHIQHKGDPHKYLGYVLGDCEPPRGLGHLSIWDPPTKSCNLTCRDVVEAIRKVTGAPRAQICECKTGRSAANALRDLGVAICDHQCANDDIARTFGINSRSTRKKYRDRWTRRTLSNPQLTDLEHKVRALLKKPRTWGQAPR